jgi:hypothetical protein
MLTFCWESLVGLFGVFVGTKLVQRPDVVKIALLVVSASRRRVIGRMDFKIR